jgi:hypothetical protein
VRESREREFKEWKERYEIPFDQEFNVKQLLQIREEIEETPTEHVRTRKDLIDIADRIQYHMRLNPKLPEKQYDYKLLVVGNNSQLYNLYEFFRMILNEKDIKSIFSGAKVESYKFSIELHNGVTIIGRYKNAEQIYGYKIDNYINLSGDKEFEENVLKPMLKQK